MSAKLTIFVGFWNFVPEFYEIDTVKTDIKKQIL